MALDAIRTMQAKDVVASKMASAYVTVDGNRYLLFQAKDLTATLEKNKVEVPILGRMNVGHKSTSMNGTGSLTIYHNTALFDEMLIKFKTTGVDTYFDIQVSLDDPTSDAGRQTVILKDCNIDSGDIIGFDADGDWNEQSIDFTFEDVEMPEKFATLDGMTQ